MDFLFKSSFTNSKEPDLNTKEVVLLYYLS